MSVLPRSGLCIAILSSSVLLTGAAADAGKESPGYVLFMGADIAIEQGKEFYKVNDVAGSNFIIRVDGKEELIPTQKGTARMRIDNGLKLGGSAIAIDKLETERAYTLARDPNRRFSNMSGMGNVASTAGDLSGSAVANAELALRTASADPNAPADLVPSMQANLRSTIDSQSNAFASANSDINSVGSRANELQVELAKENFDAIQISMEVSSPVPLDDPYVLVVARIHERDEKPGVFRNWIYAEKVDAIGPKPHRVVINRGGLPTGYSIEECQVRIYNHGREVPSNHSPKKVELTKDQAQQYIVIEHLAANKGATMPALPVLCQAPPDLKQRVAAGDFAEPFFVKVDSSGSAKGIFADRDCKREVDDPYVGAIVAAALFTPALDKGKAVDGVARLQLGALLN